MLGKRKKAAEKQQAQKALELKSDLRDLLAIARKPITTQTAIAHHKEQYLAVQSLRSKYALAELPRIIAGPGLWVKNVNEIPYSFRDDDGEWYNPLESGMKKWENSPTEEGPMVSATVTPFGAWMYNHRSWSNELAAELEKFLAA